MWHEADNIGGAVGDGVCLAAVGVAPCRVEVYDIGRGSHAALPGLLYEVLGCRVDDDGVLHAHDTEVMACYAAQLLLPLHIIRPAELAAHEREVDTETTGQIGENGILRASCQARLVECGGLARALFHGDVGREDDSLVGCPCGNLVACPLPSVNLPQGHGHVYAVGSPVPQCQLPDIVLPVGEDEVTCGGRDDVVVCHAFCCLRVSPRRCGHASHSPPRGVGSAKILIICDIM